MGSFDEIYVGCPDCGTLNAFQSKAGKCVLNTYTLKTAPAAILIDLTDRIENCNQCGCRIMILSKIVTQGWAVKITPELQAYLEAQDDG